MEEKIELKVYDPKNNKVLKTVLVDDVYWENIKCTKKTKALNKVEWFDIFLRYEDITAETHREGGDNFVFYKNKAYFERDFFANYNICPYCKKITKINKEHRLRGYHGSKYRKYISGDRTLYYCDDCWNNIIPRPLPYGIYNYHEYNRFVQFVYHKTPSDKNNCLQIGVELEIELGNNNCSSESNGDHVINAREISLAAGEMCDISVSDMLITSYDCSLHDGFEIISQPMSMDYHKKIINWEAALHKAHELGYKSHSGGHCGLHMHVNRNYFKGETSEVENKITTIIMNNKYWIVPFSRRKRWTYCEFPKGLNNLSKNKVVLSEDVVNGELKNASLRNVCLAKSSSHGHSSALNFNNTFTIEFRFFRGTLLASTFFASMEMVQMTCEMANMFSIEECANVNLQTYCLFARERGYKNFLDYINNMNDIPSCKTVLSREIIKEEKK